MNRFLATLLAALFLAAIALPAGPRQAHVPINGRQIDVRQIRPSRPTVTALQMVQARAIARQARGQERKARAGERTQRTKGRSPTTITRGFDWTVFGIATRVKDQGMAGTCWAHAGVEALEASVEIVTDTFPLLAVQPILDATQDGSGGTAQMVFAELVNTGTGLTQDYPYLGGGKLNPKPKNPLPYRASGWGYVTTADGLASVAQIKQALLTYGPLYTTMYAGTPAFMNTKGIVPVEKGPWSDPNHAVLLVGWNESRKAWKIKNSWGTSWGDRGFALIPYGQYKLGSGTTWVQPLAQ